jgi:RimJ/RimL family protein N-acetyltransferase
MSLMFKGERVSLCMVERADLPLFTQWFADYDLMRLLHPGAVRLVNEDAELEWFERMQNDSRTWCFAIVVGAEQRLVGSCSLMNVEGKNRKATLGISIADPTARGQGLGFEAMTLLLEFGFLELNLNRIQLHVFGFNERAVKLYERLGFEREGILRQSVYREGRYWDEHIMGLLREAYKPRAGWQLDQGVVP